MEDYVQRHAASRGGKFLSLMVLMNLLMGLLLAFIHAFLDHGDPLAAEAARTTLWVVYFSLLVLSAVVAGVIVLAGENRRRAERESASQTAMLREQIDAHKLSVVALQRAKEVAEGPISPSRATSSACRTRSVRRSTPSMAMHSCWSVRRPTRRPTR
jgi:hypothetical protein